MKWRLSKHLNLATDRVRPEDARRQTETAAEILRRFDDQPGVILSDEVGMGKTFVALAVAASVVEATGATQPVVIKVPNSVRDKWPRDWQFFAERCLPGGMKIRATNRSHNDATSFLKLLDDTEDQRHHILFMTHQALTGSLSDPWVRLALISHTFVRFRSLAEQRQQFPRWAGRIVNRALFGDPELAETLLHQSPTRWREAFLRHKGKDLEDDPVPLAVVEAMRQTDLRDLAAALEQVPLRASSLIEERLAAVRKAVGLALQDVWRAALRRLNLSLPLLILDEAHHLKNPDTRLAGILSNPEGEENEERGPLGGVFDRMLFLTATPFQLGHRELIEILHRFEGVRWPDIGSRQTYAARVATLEQRLSEAQLTAQRLDLLWGRLRPEDRPEGSELGLSLDAETPGLSDPARQAILQAAVTAERIRRAEQALKPWVIRHGRPDRSRRRHYRPGRSILTDADERRGLEVSGEAVFAFLLAARAQAVLAARSRVDGRRHLAVFAEGLASSYEAFRETRQRRLEEAQDDRPESLANSGEEDPEVRWYLSHIEDALPAARRDAWGRHPKISATVERVANLWQHGEKVVVFCFYRATGRALRRHISHALRTRILAQAAPMLGLETRQEQQIEDRLRRFGDRFFDRDSPIAERARARVEATLRENLPDDGERERFANVVLRFLRTPSFLVRFLDLATDDLAASFDQAYSADRDGRLSLEAQIALFGAFIRSRTGTERDELYEALDSIQTGDIFTRGGDPDDADKHDENEEHGPLLPNVRLVNGATDQDLRHRLMLAFNSPFFPEVLVASAVMSEGVDLHLSCRHVIHHDLDWNPSTLEQRTGRLDRMGSKAERLERPVEIYEPFLEATQDEKQFLVVKDRERWFNVVLGQQMTLDEWSTDNLAERLPLPEELARRLTMRLELD